MRRTKCKTAMLPKRSHIVCTDRCRQLPQISKKLNSTRIKKSIPRSGNRSLSQGWGIDEKKSNKTAGYSGSIAFNRFSGIVKCWIIYENPLLKIAGKKARHDQM